MNNPIPFFTAAPALARSVAVLALVVALPAQAQLIDELELRREGNDAVVQVRFVTEIQYQRAAVGRSGDLTQAFYLVLPTRQTLNLVTSERRLPGRLGPDAGRGLPTLVVTDESSAGRASNERRLLIRLDASAPHQVRAGRGNRSIEVVFAGLGSAVAGPLVGRERAAPAAAAASATTPPLSAGMATPSGAPADGAAVGGAASAAPTMQQVATQAAAWLQMAQAALARQDAGEAIARLTQLLDLLPNPSTRQAQALIGDARRLAGDTARARAEYALFLRQYPTGEDSDRVRQALAALGDAPEAKPTARAVAPSTSLSGSVSSFYYGGQSKVRTQEFQDSPLSGLPELVSDAALSATDQRQLLSAVDVNWRQRDAEVDRRFVFRDTYTKDFLRSAKTRNKLSALYFEQRLLTQGVGFRVGRQSPQGGGVLGRFDGAQASWTFRPKWKASVVAGVPTDALLDAKRHFYGASLDVDGVAPGLGGAVYGIQQVVDGQVDRRALGSEWRYFEGGLSATGQLDYDLVLKGLNVASVQGSWQGADNTAINFMVDRRATPMLMLGNALFFADPNLLVRPTRVSDLLAAKGLQALRGQVKATTAMATQASVGFTKPISPRWQVGGDVRYTNVGAIAPVPDILPSGMPSTGDLWSLGLQAIGSNLYSARDTHVVMLNLLTGPAFKGQLISYNNSSQLTEAWLLEPSLKYYQQSDNTGLVSHRWSTGLRVSYRLQRQLTLESEVSLENSRSAGPNRNESSRRSFYYLGARHDF